MVKLLQHLHDREKRNGFDFSIQLLQDEVTLPEGVFSCPSAWEGQASGLSRKQGRRRSLDHLPSPPTTLRWWRLVFANPKFYPTGRPTTNTREHLEGFQKNPLKLDEVDPASVFQAAQHKLQHNISKAENTRLSRDLIVMMQLPVPGSGVACSFGATDGSSGDCLARVQRDWRRYMKVCLLVSR
jgi:hypothetical protein